MIPSIETICEDLVAGRITVQQAVGWLHQHAEGAANDLRDHFAGLALAGRMQQDDTGLSVPHVLPRIAAECYLIADAMLAASKDGRK